MAKRKSKTRKVKVRSNTTLQYTGDVSIKVLRKGKVVRSIRNHNDGNAPLFKFILDCLAGEYHEENRPTWIVPFHTEEDKDYYSIPKIIPVNQFAVLQSGEEYVLSYRCLMSSTYFGNSTKIDGLLFYSGTNAPTYIQTNAPIPDNDNYSMRMSLGLDSGSGGNIFQDEDIIVTWQIRIATAKQTDYASYGQ